MSSVMASALLARDDKHVPKWKPRARQVTRQKNSSTEDKNVLGRTSDSETCGLASQAKCLGRTNERRAKLPTVQSRADHVLVCSKIGVGETTASETQMAKRDLFMGLIGRTHSTKERLTCCSCRLRYMHATVWTHQQPRTCRT